jgi:WD40 repeat protein
VPAPAIWKLQSAPGSRRWHVESVTFTLDGKRLASCGNGNIVRSWDLTTGAVIKKLLGQTGWITKYDQTAPAPAPKSISHFYVKVYKRLSSFQINCEQRLSGECGIGLASL